jgi:MFS family permease
LSPNIWTAGIAIALVGGTYICVLSGLNTVVQLRAPQQARGRVLSIYMMALGAIYPVGLILEGAIGQEIGVRVMTVASGLILGVVLGLLAIINRPLFSALSVARNDDASSLPIDVATREVGEIDLGARDEWD